MRFGEADLAEAETILIAVNDGVLADSLRFSLELEGFATRFCDESSLFPAMSAPRPRGGCLVLDQDVFARMVEDEDGGILADKGMPVVLMVSISTKWVLARAEAAGVTEVVEKPLLGGVLCDAIRQAIDGEEDSNVARLP
jgi:FixJ family two-component response regulator